MQIGFRRQIAGGQHGRRHVGCDDGLIANASRFGDAGKSDDPRFADAPFVEPAFARPERRVAGDRRPAEVVLIEPAVVAGKDHKCVLRQLQLVERGHYSTNVVVHRLNHRGIGGIALENEMIAQA